MEVVTVGEHDEQLALLIGHIALETASLDYWTCHVVAKVLGDGQDAWLRYFGQSGQQLLDGLSSASLSDERLRPLTSAMRSVVDRRNQAVHGLWFLDAERGRTSYEIVRPKRKSVDSDDRFVTLGDLEELRADIATLNTYVFVVWSSLTPSVQYGTGEPLPATQLLLPPLAGISERFWRASPD